MRIIENQKLKKLISRGPNFRGPTTIHWGHCKTEITSGLETYIERVCNSCPDIKPENLTGWKNEVLKSVDRDIERLKKKIKQQRTNPVLKQEEVSNYLNLFHEKYVMTPIDKASSNVSVICKRYYVEVVLNEIGILGDGSDTYEKANRSKEEIIDEVKIAFLEVAKDMGDITPELLDLRSDMQDLLKLVSDREFYEGIENIEAYHKFYTDNCQDFETTNEDFKDVATKFQISFNKSFRVPKIFHYLKLIRKQEGNEACLKFYNDNLVSYGKYLQVSDVKNFT